MHVHHKPSLILFVQIEGKCNLEELATDYKAYQWAFLWNQTSFWNRLLKDQWKWTYHWQVVVVEPQARALGMDTLPSFFPLQIQSFLLKQGFLK